jgi:hypothetical protein
MLIQDPDKEAIYEGTSSITTLRDCGNNIQRNISAGEAGDNGTDVSKNQKGGRI